jgi:hypothetical protein
MNPLKLTTMKFKERKLFLILPVGILHGILIR